MKGLALVLMITILVVTAKEPPQGKRIAEPSGFEMFPDYASDREKRAAGNGPPGKPGRSGPPPGTSEQRRNKFIEILKLIAADQCPLAPTPCVDKVETCAKDVIFPKPGEKKSFVPDGMRTIFEGCFKELFPNRTLPAPRQPVSPPLTDPEKIEIVSCMLKAQGKLDAFIACIKAQSKHG